MKNFIKKTRFFALAVAIALAVQPLASMINASTAHAYPSYSPSPMMPAPVITAGGSSTAGGWIVGGLFVSVASIIACAMIVGSEEGREMTLEEALLSGAIPLGCLFREHLNAE